MSGPPTEEYAPIASTEPPSKPSPSSALSPQSVLLARRMISISILSLFIIAILSLGLVDHFAPVPISKDVLNTTDASPASKPKIPDLSRYGESLKTLSSHELRLKKGGRMIVVGDLHGMKGPLDHLLKKLGYKPHKDTLIHSGDILTKGVRPTQTLEFLAANNITGVRGNHDQQIIEWRSWFNWVRSFPDGPDWIDNYHDGSVWTEAGVPSETGPQSRMFSIPNVDKFPFPDDWKWASEHWRIARTMTDAQYKYLLSLPLVLHIPSLHTFVVHGGLVPVDPTRGVTSSHQPLARIPKVPKGLQGSTKELRTLQEVAVIEEIPQNQDPWANLNIRSILNSGDVSKKNDQGSPWPRLWNKIMNRCGGFSPKHKKEHLPCYPITVMYGHAASRGLDIQKWSKGLDSGCVYGRRLTALVYSETPASPEAADPLLEGDGVEVMNIPYGNNPGTTQLVSVEC